MRSNANRILMSLAVLLCAMLAWTWLWPRPPRLVWNASPSSPLGLYVVGPAASLRSGDFAIAWPPPTARALADQRHYLPDRVPLVKKVAATGGSTVCAQGRTILIDGRPAAVRRLQDLNHRRLPWWSGCTRLKPGEVLLLSADIPTAFDGRYFGVTRASEIIGSGTLLWPR